MAHIVMVRVMPHIKWISFGRPAKRIMWIAFVRGRARRDKFPEPTRSFLPHGILVAHQSDWNPRVRAAQETSTESKAVTRTKN